VLGHPLLRSLEMGFKNLFRRNFFVVEEAVRGGARVLCGGKRQGAFYDATILENVNPKIQVSCVEVFGPVATLQPFSSFADAIRIANDSTFGLQAGVFTNNLQHALQAFNELEVGGVIINDIPSFRVDNMPYGGIKDSGFGREGIRFAIEEMTEIKLMVLRNSAGVRT
jgi:acyl-CoA reductase-like NAD-dependent aldehyde dehydrogenase